jgi:hypothetical protein
MSNTFYALLELADLNALPEPAVLTREAKPVKSAKAETPTPDVAGRQHRIRNVPEPFGVPLKVRPQCLGHSDPSITPDVYPRRHRRRCTDCAAIGRSSAPKKKTAQEWSLLSRYI